MIIYYYVLYNNFFFDYSKFYDYVMVYQQEHTLEHNINICYKTSQHLTTERIKYNIILIIFKH